MENRIIILIIVLVFSFFGSVIYFIESDKRRTDNYREYVGWKIERVGKRNHAGQYYTQIQITSPTGEVGLIQRPYTEIGFWSKLKVVPETDTFEGK